MANPPPAPGQQPQIIYVKEKPRTSCLTWLVAILAIPFVIGFIIVQSKGGLSGDPSRPSPRQQARAAKDQALAALEIVDWKWSKEKGFGNVMEATFKIRNKGAVDVKDIEIECVHTAPSGTVIDSNKRTIFEIIKAGETREFKDFNMGFIHSQVKSSSARIKDAVPMETPAPAKTEPPTKTPAAARS